MRHILLVYPAVATECDPQLGSHCQDSSHCTMMSITSHEGDIKSYHMWQHCLAVLCDVWRSTGRGSGRCGVQHTSILFSIAGRNHLPLKSLPPPLVICPHLCTCHNALHCISLSIRVLLFMLLVVAGDVERNPGPPKYVREGK